VFDIDIKRQYRCKNVEIKIRFYTASNSIETDQYTGSEGDVLLLPVLERTGQPKS